MFNFMPLPVLEQVDRTFVEFRGRKLSYFAGCDYFKLSWDRRVMNAVKRTMDSAVLNVAASRVTTGNHPLYEKLERQLAAFFQAEAAVLVPTGFLTNLVAAQALSGECSHAFLDRASHPSLQEAAKLLDCPIVEFGWKDPDSLRIAQQRLGPRIRPVVLTDGFFARDGSIAPLEAYRKLLPRDGYLFVDDAHAAGILGEHGRGSLEYHKIRQRNTVQTVTLSKAFGAYGGAILCSAGLRKSILEKSTIFAGSTPLPLPLVSAALESLSIIGKEGKRLRQRLQNNAEFLRQNLSAAGVELPWTTGPIIAIPSGSVSSRKMERELLKENIFPSFIRYPGMEEGLFRFVISSEHSTEQLESLARAIAAGSKAPTLRI